jgi:hypothetical protein
VAAGDREDVMRKVADTYPLTDALARLARGFAAPYTLAQNFAAPYTLEPTITGATKVTRRLWKGGDWDEVDVTMFGHPVPQTHSMRPDAKTVIRYARNAYIASEADDALGTFEQIVAIALGLEEGDIEIAWRPETGLRVVAVPVGPPDPLSLVAPETPQEHLDMLYRLDERFRGEQLPEWAWVQWNQSAEIVENETQRQRKLAERKAMVRKAWEAS